MTIGRRLLAALGPVRTPMALSVAARVLQLTAGLALTAGAAWGVAALAEGRISQGWGLLAVLAGLAAVKAIAGYVEQYQGHHVAFGLLAAMRTDFFRRVEPLAPAVLVDTRSGDLVDRVMSDVDRVEVFYAHTVAPVVAGVVVPAWAVAAVAMWMDAFTALALGTAMALVGYVVPFLSNRAAREAADEAAAVGGELAAHVTDGIQGLREVIVFDYGHRRLAEMSDLDDSLARAERAVARIDGAGAAVNQVVMGGALAAVAYRGLALVQGGELGLPGLAAALALALVGFAPLRDLQQVKPAYDRAMAAAARIFSITDRRPMVSDPAEPSLPPATPDLRFRKVAFSYPDGSPAVEDVELTVESGSRVAVVGPSGAGKSTLARLAVRFWDPTRGSVSLGDGNVAGLSLADLRRTVTVVTQESHLFAGSVADNLRLGRPEASHGELRRAAHLAAVDEDIASFPEGYETQVGEMGVRLSGGQRQRIALARALLAAGPVLVLDEATSELDTETEELVLQRLRRQINGRAVLVIAHRLATVSDAQEIVVMDRGVIVDRGTHRELLARGGLYARLWALQLDRL